MTGAVWLALVGALGIMALPCLIFIGALALILSQLDRRRYVRRLHRMRRG